MSCLDFDQLVRDHHKRLVDYAWSIIRDHAAAQDAAQEAWVKAWQRRDQYEEQGRPPIAWLQTLTRNAAYAQVRPVSTWAGPMHPLLVPAVGEVVDDLPQPVISDFPGLEDPDAAPGIAHALEILTPMQRRAIGAYCMQGLDYPEMADLLGVSVNTVRTHVCVGLQRIRDYFADTSVAWSSGWYH